MIVSAIIGVLLCKCILLLLYFPSVEPVHQLVKQLAHEGFLQVVLCKARVGLSVRRIRSALNRWWESRWILDFSSGKYIFIMLLLTLRLRLRHYSFIPVIELNYRAIFSRKKLNINWLFSFLYLFFWKWFIVKMTKQEAFLLCSTMLARTLQNFFKILSMDFTICWWHLCKFFENHKSKKSINFPFCHYQMFSKSTRRNERM